VTASVIQFLVCATVIVLAGFALTQFGDIISERTKLGGMFVGSVLIAGATSLPELAIDFNAVRMGAVDLAVGDLVGSSIFNLLILAVLDLTHHSRGRMFSSKSAGHALAATTSIALTAIVAVSILLGPKLGDFSFARLGPGSVLLIMVYGLGARLVFKGQSDDADARESEEREAAPPWARKLGIRGASIGYLAAAAAILAAAPFLAHAADDLAQRSGLGGTFFGSTFVALCTSLPEIVTTFVAVRMRAFDLAIGNIFGSNCFNMLCFVPLDFIDAGSLLSRASLTHAYTALCAILITAVVVMGQLYRVERRKSFVEPDAWVAIALIVGSLTGLYFLRE
jgi:cation:H+ antiporter